LFINELFRIGGIRTLKGFDEQAIFASTYLIVNTELRYLLQQNSNVILFWNGAYYRNSVRSPVLTDRPYGFGAGFNFETGAGIFSIFYAVGKEFNNPIDFNKAKVHFGFVNYF
jgi:hemolysin activation/secretion protein